MIEKDKIRKILVINLAFIGDVLLASPVARGLKEAFPHASIDMLVVPLTAQIAERNPYVRRVFSYDKRGRHKKAGELFRLIRSLCAENYDMAVSLNFSLRSAFMAWACGAGCRIGYAAQGGGALLTHTVPPDRSVVRHETENHLAVLSPLGITVADTSLALAVRPEDVAGLQAGVKLDRDKPLAVFCPVGSYPRKSLPAERFAEIIAGLAPMCQCVLIGSARDGTVLNSIRDASGVPAAVLAGSLNLGALSALIQTAGLLVTVDTGPLHIAEAVGTPAVALFGPTDPAIWGPRNAGSQVFYLAKDCSPCWGKRDCARNDCLLDIPAEAIVRAAAARLRRK